MELKFAIGPEQKRMWETLQFFARLMVLSLPLYAIIHFGVNLYQLQLAVAGHLYQLFSLWGLPIVQDGVLFTLTGENAFSFVIGEDCIAWKSMLFLFALIFAVPKIQNKKRLTGLAIGLPLIWIGNLARILGIVWVQQAFGSEVALFLHDVGWQIGLVALVLVLWVIWLEWSKIYKGQNT